MDPQPFATHPEDTQPTDPPPATQPTDPPPAEAQPEEPQPPETQPLTAQAWSELQARLADDPELAQALRDDFEATLAPLGYHVTDAYWRKEERTLRAAVGSAAEGLAAQFPPEEPPEEISIAVELEEAPPAERGPASRGAPLTGGFDAVVEIGEDLINRLVFAYHYLGLFPRPQGSYVLPIENPPPELVPLLTVGYDVRLDVPRLDFRAPDGVALAFGAEATLTLLGGFSFEVEVSFNVAAGIRFDAATRHLQVDFRDAQVDAAINDGRLPPAAAEALDRVLAAVLRQAFAERLPFLDLSPFVSWNLTPAGAGTTLSAALGGMKLTDRVGALGGNLLGATGGDAAAIADFTSPRDVGLGISEAGIRRALDFWWSHGGAPPQVYETGERELPGGNSDFESYFNFLINSGILGWIFGVKFQGLFLTYDYKLDVEKPSIDLHAGNRLSVSGEARVQFSAQLIVRYKIYQPWKFKWKEYTTRIASWTDDVHLSYRGSAKLSLLGSGQLQARVVQALVFLRRFPPLASIVINTLANVFAPRLVQRLPVMSLGSFPLQREIPGTPLVIAWTPALATTDHEALVTAAVRLAGLERLPASPFIANLNRKCREVHRADCRWVEKIRSSNRLRVFYLEEAHARGFDNCHYCLGGSTR
ncbi:MAG TPA: hypothetical protein VFX98_18630 [Longimicrobiaceae bacterium]|nr:hypothetical protein [Longimicrobiaceae bacterium]